MKKENRAKVSNGRVLARLLAEDLRHISGACECPKQDVPTVEITGGGTDLTNTGPDGD